MHPQHENPRSFPIKPYGASSRNCATFLGWLPQMPLRKKLPGISFIVKLSMGSVQLPNNKPIA
jgi:hypothetical protein